MKASIQNLESDLKAKTKECDQLQTELEVAKNETQVETDSQLTVQAQLKNDVTLDLRQQHSLRGAATETL